jgi:hypothetical protein
LEQGDIATDYIATTSAAVSVGPVSGLPRLDYLNSSCPRLLLEPQRTNLFNFSEQLDNAYWSKIGSLTITANTNVSPDGYTNADLVTTTAAPARIQREFTGLTAGTRTLSCFVKAGTGSTFRINTFDGIVDKGATFNVATGSVISTGTGVTATITNYGNGWYRVTHNYTSAGTAYSCQFFFDDVGTYQVYGFQFEDLVSYATSYIPTLGTSVTRVVDAALKTGISSLIGQTEGTIFAEVYISQLQGAVARTLIDIGSTNNRIFVGFTGEASNTMRLQIDTSVSSLRVDVRAVVSSAGTIKVAAAYKNGECALYVNGVAGTIVANNSFSFTTISNLFLGQTLSSTAILDDGITKALLFKTRLSNSDLASLTTL